MSPAGPRTSGASVLPLGLHTRSSLLPRPDTDRDDDVDVDTDAGVNVDGNIGVSLGILMPPHTAFQSLLSHYLFHDHLMSLFSALTPTTTRLTSLHRIDHYLICTCVSIMCFL